MSIVETILIPLAIDLAAGEASSAIKSIQVFLKHSKRVDFEELLMSSLKRASEHHKESYDEVSNTYLEKIIDRVIQDPKPFLNTIDNEFSGGYGEFLNALESRDKIKPLCQNILEIYAIEYYEEHLTNIFCNILLDCFGFYKVSFFEKATIDDEIRVILFESLKIPPILKTLERVEAQLKNSFSTEEFNELRGEIRQLSKSLETFGIEAQAKKDSPSNPFEPFSPASLTFTGRKEQLHELSILVENLNRNESFSRILTGPSGVGKTSLIRQLETNTDARIRFIREDISNYNNTGEFIISFLMTIFSTSTHRSIRDLKGSLKRVVESFSAEYSDLDRTAELIGIVEPLIHSIHDTVKPSLIVIDQAERMLYLETKLGTKLIPAKLVHEVILMLTELRIPIGIILVLRQEDIGEYLSQISSSRTAPYLFLSNLNFSDVVTLLNSTLASNASSLDDEVLNLFYRFSDNGHPLKIQLLGKWVYEISRNHDGVSIEAFNKLAIFSNSDLFTHLISELDSLERELLRVLSQHQATIVSKTKIRNLLKWDETQFELIALRLYAKSLIRITKVGIEFSSEGVKENCYDAFQTKKIESLEISGKEILLLDKIFRSYSSQNRIPPSDFFDEYSNSLTKLLQSSSNSDVESFLLVPYESGFIFQSIQLLSQLIEWAAATNNNWLERLLNLLYEIDITTNLVSDRHELPKAIFIILRSSLWEKDGNKTKELYTKFRSQLSNWEIRDLGKLLIRKIDEKKGFEEEYNDLLEQLLIIEKSMSHLAKPV